MKNLIQDLKTGQLKNIYLFTGEEDYLKKQYRQRLQAALVPPGDTVNLNCFEGKNIPVQELIDLGETMPFFAERRLLVVEDSGFFKSASAQLCAYLEHVPPTTYFLFVESEVDKRQKLYKVVKSRGRIVEFARQTEETLTNWILTVLKKENKNITRRAMELFLEKAGDDMNNIRSELDKLLAYTAGREVIAPEDVEAICTTRTVNKIFDMVNAIAAGDRRRALDLYYDLLALKEPPMRILFLISRQFNQLLQTKELRGHGYDADSIAAKLGVPRFAAQMCARQCEHFTMEKLRGLVEQCVRTEEDVKTGNLNERLGVELILTHR